MNVIGGFDWGSLLKFLWLADLRLKLNIGFHNDESRRGEICKGDESSSNVDL